MHNLQPHVAFDKKVCGRVFLAKLAQLFTKSKSLASFHQHIPWRPRINNVFVLGAC